MMLPWVLAASTQATPEAGEDIDEKMPRGAAEGAIPAIDEPTFSQGRWLGPEDEVIAVHVDGQARAYPIRVLDYHEIVNDVIADRPIAVTFCPLAGASIAWDRTVDSEVLSFIVSGRLYRNDLVMKDEPTGSLWPQITGRALHGPRAGTQLEPVPSWRTSWKQFARTFPEARVLDRPAQYPAIRYESRAQPGYADSDATMYDPIHEDHRLARKDPIIGLARGNDALAVRQRDLQELGLTICELDGEDLVLGRLEERIVAWWTGGRSFRVDDDRHLVGPEGSRWDPYRGRNGDKQLQPAPAVPCFWFAWVDIHPDTRLWHEEE